MELSDQELSNQKFHVQLGRLHTKETGKGFTEKSSSSSRVSYKSSKSTATTGLTTTIELQSDHNHNFDTEKTTVSLTGPKSRPISPVKESVKSKVTSKKREQVHSRYEEYLNKSQEEKDRSKTDYTYAHSYSYSEFVAPKERNQWDVPNMSRNSVNFYKDKFKRTNYDHNHLLLDKAAISKGEAEFNRTRYEHSIRRNQSSSQYSIGGQITEENITDYYSKRFQPRNAFDPDEEDPFDKTRISKAEAEFRRTRINLSLRNQSDSQLSVEGIAEMGITSQQTTKTARATRAIPFNVNEEMASTPIKSTRSTAATSKKAAHFEYSDDDDDEMQFIEQPVTNGRVKSKANGKRAARNAPITNDPYDAQLSEEEEEITIIRRINRYVVTTVRNFFSSPNKDEPMEVDGDDHVAGPSDDSSLDPGQGWQQSASASSSSRNERHQVNHRRSVHYYDLPSDGSSGAGNCRLMWLVFLLPLLLSGGAYYLYSGNNLDNLLGDFGASSSSVKFASFFDTLWFARSSSMPPTSDGGGSHGRGVDVSQLNFEIASIRNELHKVKNLYEETAKEAAARGQAPPPPPGPNVDDILARLAALELKLTSCCQQSTVVPSNLTDIIESEVKQLLDAKMHHFQAQYDRQLQREVDQVKTTLLTLVREQAANYSSTQTGSDKDGSLDPMAIEAMIKTAISKYDADKTGLADFALESSGAWVVSTRCSETYELFSASYKLLGLTLWRSRNTPRVVIQSGVVPGECWCFKGAEGRIAFHLSARIIPTAFTYEHIPVSLSRDGHIHSAPAKFTVYGLKAEDDIEPEILGDYVYSIEEGVEPMQRFEVQNTQTALHTFRYIELVVKANHGHPEYTCLYRFRVHGTPVFDEGDQ